MAHHLDLLSGAVAQLGERRLCKAEVRGSSPLGSTRIVPSELSGVDLVSAWHIPTSTSAADPNRGLPSIEVSDA